MYHRFALASAFLFTAVTAQAQDTYTINLKKAAKGDVLRIQKIDNETENVKTTTPDGTAVEEKNTKNIKTWHFEETIVERPDLKTRATVVKRTYTKATAVMDKDNIVLPYQGKTIVITKKGDGKYAFKYEGGADIAGKDAEFLEQEFNMDGEDEDLEAIMLPKKAVAIDEAWKIPMAEFLKAFEKQAKLSIHADKATGTGKLVKAYKKDNRQYGDFVITLNLPIKALKIGPGELPCKEGAVLTVTMKASGCIDGSISDERAEWSVNLKGSANVPADNPMAVINFLVNRMSEGSTVEAAKK